MNIGRAFSVRRFLSSWKEQCVLWCLDEAFFDSCLVCVLYSVEQWCVSSPLWVWFLVHRFLTTARNWRVKFFLCWHNVIPYYWLSLILSHSVMFLFCLTVMLSVGLSHSVVLNVWFCLTQSLNVSGSVQLSHVECPCFCLSHVECLGLSYSVMFWCWLSLVLSRSVMLNVPGSVSVMLNVWFYFTLSFSDVDCLWFCLALSCWMSLVLLLVFFVC